MKPSITPVLNHSSMFKIDVKSLDYLNCTLKPIASPSKPNHRHQNEGTDTKDAAL